jgi:hypothetical protein
MMWRSYGDALARSRWTPTRPGQETTGAKLAKEKRRDMLNLRARVSRCRASSPVKTIAW